MKESAQGLTTLGTSNLAHGFSAALHLSHYQRDPRYSSSRSLEVKKNKTSSPLKLQPLDVESR